MNSTDNSEKYLDYFFEFNEPTKEKYKIAAASYETNYKKFFPSDKNSRILDIGCGMGHFLYYLKTKGYTNFNGIDLGKQQIAFCKKYIDINVEKADAFEYLKDKKNEFDVIIMNDVIEHIKKANVVELLEYINNSLKEEGKVIIKTPNMSNPFGLVSRYQDFTHEAGYNESSILYILNASGFNKVSVFSEIYANIGLNRRILNIVRSIIYKILKLACLIDRGTSPKIFSPNIIIVAEK